MQVPGNVEITIHNRLQLPISRTFRKRKSKINELGKFKI